MEKQREAKFNNYSFMVERRDFYVNQMKYYEKKTIREDADVAVAQKSQEDTITFLKKEIAILDFLIEEYEGKNSDVSI